MPFAVFVRRWTHVPGGDPARWDDVPDSQLAGEIDRWRAELPPPGPPGGVGFIVPGPVPERVPRGANGLEHVEDQRCVLIIDDVVERDARLVGEYLQRALDRAGQEETRVGVVDLDALSPVERLEALEGGGAAGDLARLARGALARVRQLAREPAEVEPPGGGERRAATKSPPLTPRQREILAILNGADHPTSIKLLAGRLDVSTSTVEKDLTFMRKLDAPLVLSSSRGFELTEPGRARVQGDRQRGA